MSLTGYAGKNKLDEARVDMVVDSVEDGCTGVLGIFFEADPKVKVQLPGQLYAQYMHR